MLRFRDVKAGLARNNVKMIRDYSTGTLRVFHAVDHPFGPSSLACDTLDEALVEGMRVVRPVLNHVDLTPKGVIRSGSIRAWRAA